MHPRIREIIDQCKYCQATIGETAALLPADDAELDGWIAEAVKNHDQDAFIYLVFSAVHAGRKVSSRHLSGGLAMLPEYTTMGCIAWHMDGDDVPEQLFAGLREGGINNEMRIGALYVAAAWCKERREGVLPENLLTEARIFARNKKLAAEPSPLGLLFALARMLGDARLLELLRVFEPLFKSKEVALTAADEFGKLLLNHCRGPIFNRIPETPSHEVSGYTVRRAVAHIGRNELCPCGSGKKYKRCCVEKDKERLRLSSNVAGKTYAELWADPEQHLTSPLLEKLDPAGLARLDPIKIAPALLPRYFTMLGAFVQLDLAAQSFEKVGCPENVHDVWHYVMWQAVREGRKDLAERLMKVRGTLPPGEPLHPGAQLLLVRDDPAAFLKTLEDVATKALGTADSTELEKFAYGILTSPLRALGILVARGMIPIAGKKDAVFLLDQILIARERLNLSADDPYSDILDRRFHDEDVSGGGKDTEALRITRQQLEAKAGEVRQMKLAIDHLRKEIERREKKPPVPAQPHHPVPVAPADEKTLHELRDKVGMLKSALKERHSERADLRRKLEKTLTDLETLRAEQARHEPRETEQPHADREEHLLLPGDVDGNQPVRLIEFPGKFHDTLAGFPRAVSRGAMAMLGRLAAGEPSAFVGVVRLQACPATLRVRIGSDYRMLFRLLPDRVQVVDLINRKDLERRIKTL
jgi:hypothetical protein